MGASEVRGRFDAFAPVVSRDFDGRRAARARDGAMMMSRATVVPPTRARGRTAGAATRARARGRGETEMVFFSVDDAGVGGGEGVGGEAAGGDRAGETAPRATR